MNKQVFKISNPAEYYEIFDWKEIVLKNNRCFRVVGEEKLSAQELKKRDFSYFYPKKLSVTKECTQVVSRYDTDCITDFKHSVVYFNSKWFFRFCDLLWFHCSGPVLYIKHELDQAKKISIGRNVQKTWKNIRFFHLDKFLLKI